MKSNSNKPQKSRGLSVAVYNDNFNDAMRKFKRKVQSDGKLQTLKEKQQYIKPSERRAREKAAARARWLKKLKKNS